MPASENRSSARVAPRSVIAGRGDLGDDLLERGGRRLDAAGAGRVADGAEAHRAPRTAPRRRQRSTNRLTASSMPSRSEHLRAGGRSRSTGSSMLLVGDVLPDVELGPVRQREHPDVLALAVPAVVEAPQLGPLVLRVPLAELVAEAEDPLLGPGLLLVAAGAAEHGVEAVLLDARRAAWWSAAGCGWPAGRSPRRPGRRRWRPAPRRRPAAAPSARPSRSRNSMTSAKLWPVSTCMTGNGSWRRPERLLGQAQHHDRVLAAGEQQHRPLELGRDLADDVDRLGLELVEVGQHVRLGHTERSRPK